MKSSSVNHTVYLNYGFMATSEPQKYVINKLWYSKQVDTVDLENFGVKKEFV